jgi:glycosyltransferase involved in cell wall biosynthesis
MAVASERRTLFLASEMGFGGGERIFEDIVLEARIRQTPFDVSVPEGSALYERLTDKGIAVDAQPGYRAYSAVVCNDFKSLLRSRSWKAAKTFICHGPWEFTLKKKILAVLLRARVMFVSTYVARGYMFGFRRRLFKSQLLNYGPSKSFVCDYNLGRAEARKLLGVPNEAFVIATSARFHSVKRFELFLEILRRGQIWGAIAVSTGFNSQDEIEAQARFAEEVERITNISVSLNKDPRIVLAAADVYVSTSKFETLGVSIMEAMSFGLPVINLALGGPEEIIRHGITGFHVTSIAEAIDAISNLRSNPDLLRSMSVLAASFVTSRNPAQVLVEL